MGQFIERVKKGAFGRALERNKDVKILLNHDEKRELGSTGKGNLELKEDNIGLHARAIITDKEVIEKARNGELVGWSFGFYDRDVVKRMIDGIMHRDINDLDLDEVSILDNTKSPAYEGTLIMARSDEKIQFRAEPFVGDVEVIEETKEEEKQETRQEPKQQEVEKIDYSMYTEMIKEMKGV